MSFRENFWNAELLNNSGFETVSARLEHGQEISNAVLIFLTTRAHIEETSSKQLAKLAKNENSSTTETLGRGWLSCIESTEQASQIHKQKASAYTELSQKLSHFCNEQKRIRKSAQKNIQTLQNQKLSAAEKQKKARNDLVKKRDALESQENQLELLEWDPNKSKDLEKAKRNLVKLEKSAQDADEQYRSTVANLEMVRKQWETSLENGYEVFQELEEKRIAHLRQALWRLSNIDSLAAVQIAQQQKRMRNELRQCSVETDLQQFVRQKGTGRKRPAPIEVDPSVLLSARKPRSSTQSSITTSKSEQSLSSNSTNKTQVLEPKYTKIEKPFSSPTRAKSVTPPPDYDTVKKENPYSAVTEESTPLYSKIEKNKNSNRRSDASNRRSDASNTSLDNSFTSAVSSLGEANEENVPVEKETLRRSGVAARKGYKPPVPAKRISVEKLQKSGTPSPTRSPDDFCVVTSDRKDKDGKILLTKNSLVKLVRRNSNAMWLIEAAGGEQLICPADCLDVQNANFIHL